MVPEIDTLDFYDQNPASTKVASRQLHPDRNMMRSRRLSMVVMLIVLLFILRPTHATGQQQAAALFVTYISATPECACNATAGQLGITFRVIFYSCEPYYGSVSHPAVGITEASFLLVSTETHEAKEHSNIPVYQTATEGMYRAQIPLAPDDPTGRVLVYVKGNSLQVDGKLGPPQNTSSEQTEDTSGVSLVELGLRPSPPPFLDSNLLLLIALAVIVLLLLLLAIFARRRQKPTSLTLVREPSARPPSPRRPIRSRRNLP